MKFLRDVKTWLFGTGFEVGERVYWNNRDDHEFTGEYVVASKRDKRGYVGIYNKKMLNRKVLWHELESLD